MRRKQTVVIFIQSWGLGLEVTPASVPYMSDFKMADGRTSGDSFVFPGAF